MTARLVGAAQPGLAEYLVSLTPMFLMVAIFYFIWWVPVRKKQKELEQVVANLKKGDKVVTTGGILGEVVKAEGPILLLRISDNTKIRLRRSAIAGLETGPSQGS